MRLILFGFGAVVALAYLSLKGREAMAREEAAMLLRRLGRERTCAAWKALGK